MTCVLTIGAPGTSSPGFSNGLGLRIRRCVSDAAVRIGAAWIPGEYWLAIAAADDQLGPVGNHVGGAVQVRPRPD